MAVTLSQVTGYLTRKRYPCAILEDSDVSGFCDDALRELTAYKPLEAVAVFNTVNQVQDYFIFDQTKPEGFAVGAIDVLDVIWSPSGDIVGANNLFSVGYRLLEVLNLDQTTFERATDTDAFRKELTSWNRQYGQGTTTWEVLGQPGDPNAFLRISPVPIADDLRVLVRLTSPWTLALLNGLETSSWSRHFLLLLEMHASEAAASWEAQSAGVDLEGFKPGREGLRYWDKKHAEKYAKVVDTLGGSHAGIVERS